MSTTQITFTSQQIAFLTQWFSQQKNAYVGSVMDDEFPADEESFQNLCEATYNVSGFKVGEMLRETGDTPSAGKKVKREKAKKDPDAPKRAKTPYMNWLWSEDGMAKVKTDNPELTHKAAMSKAAEVWKGMDDDAKTTWNEMSVEQKKAYDTAMKDYTPPDGVKPSRVRKSVSKKEVNMDDVPKTVDGVGEAQGNMYLKGYADKKKYGSLEDAVNAMKDDAGGVVFDGKHYTIRKQGEAMECTQPNILWLKN